MLFFELTHVHLLFLILLWIEGKLRDISFGIFNSFIFHCLYVAVKRWRFFLLLFECIECIPLQYKLQPTAFLLHQSVPVQPLFCTALTSWLFPFLLSICSSCLKQKIAIVSWTFFKEKSILTFSLWIISNSKLVLRFWLTRIFKCRLFYY